MVHEALGMCLKYMKVSMKNQYKVGLGYISG